MFRLSSVLHKLAYVVLHCQDKFMLKTVCC